MGSGDALACVLGGSGVRVSKADAAHMPEGSDTAKIAQIGEVDDYVTQRPSLP